MLLLRVTLEEEKSCPLVVTRNSTRPTSSRPDWNGATQRTVLLLMKVAFERELPNEHASAVEFMKSAPCTYTGVSAALSARLGAREKTCTYGEPAQVKGRYGGDLGEVGGDFAPAAPARTRTAPWPSPGRARAR